MAFGHLHELQIADTEDQVVSLEPMAPGLLDDLKELSAADIRTLRTLLTEMVEIVDSEISNRHFLANNG